MTNVSRRGLFAGAGAAGVGVAFSGRSAELDVTGSSPMLERTTRLDHQNLGIITAWAPHLSAQELSERHHELRRDLESFGFGISEVRGRYLAPAAPAESSQLIRAYHVHGNVEDSGNLKGYLRKLGRKFQQHAVVVKGYYLPTVLHVLKPYNSIGMDDRDTKNLGVYRPECLGAYVQLIANISPMQTDTASLPPDCMRADANGKWLQIGESVPPTMYNSGTWTTYDENGNPKTVREFEPRGYGPLRRVKGCSSPCGE